MSIRYLLDTCVLSEPIRRHPNQTVITHIQDHQEDLATAAPVMHELWFGCERISPSRKRDLLAAYLVALSDLLVLSYDGVAARRHAEERARLESIGQAPSFVDGQIAAIAEVSGLVLVTRNVRDFARFSNLEVEDWFRC